jgi:hypothetical protein
MNMTEPKEKTPLDKWLDGIRLIRKQTEDATLNHTLGLITKNQLKKIKANSYNQERDYMKENPRPERIGTVMSPNAVSAMSLLALASLNNKILR